MQTPMAQIQKVFWLFFFKKEPLPNLTYRMRWITASDITQDVRQFFRVSHICHVVADDLKNLDWLRAGDHGALRGRRHRAVLGHYDIGARHPAVVFGR